MEKRHILVDNTEEMRYEFDLGDDKAFIEYVLGSEAIVLTHTEVPPRYAGRGIASELVKSVLEKIRDKELKLVPQCPFIATYIDRHPEWREMVAFEAAK